MVGPMGAIHAIDSDVDAAGRGSDYVATHPSALILECGNQSASLQKQLTLPMIRDGL